MTIVVQSGVLRTATSPPTYDTGSAASGLVTSGSLQLTFSTTKANLCVIYFFHNGGTFVSVTSPSLTWSRAGNSTGGSPLRSASAVSSGALTNEVVTVTMAATTTVSGIVFAINGTSTASVAAAYDAGSAVTGTSGTPSSKSTTAAATMAIVGFRGNGDGSIPSGWSSIPGNRGVLFMCVDYKAFTSAQAGTVACADTMTGINGWIYDPVKSVGQ